MQKRSTYHLSPPICNHATCTLQNLNVQLYAFIAMLAIIIHTLAIVVTDKTWGISVSWIHFNVHLSQYWITMTQSLVMVSQVTSEFRQLRKNKMSTGWPNKYLCKYTQVHSQTCNSYLLTFFCFSSCSVRCLYQSSSSCFACSRHSTFWRSDSASNEWINEEWIY